MIETTLQSMREQEEVRIDAEAAERKAAARKMFGELIAVELARLIGKMVAGHGQGIASKLSLLVG